MTLRLLENYKLSWCPLISLVFPPADLIYPESTAMGKEPQPARYEETRGRHSVRMPGGSGVYLGAQLCSQATLTQIVLYLSHRWLAGVTR